ncbi:MAG: PIN domain-containing protein [Acidobacteriaceae bacterium]
MGPEAAKNAASGFLFAPNPPPSVYSGVAGNSMDLIVIRIIFIVALTGACFFLRPFALQPWPAAVLGAIAAASVIVFELRVRALSIKRLLGAVLGSVLGIAGAALFASVLAEALPSGGTRALLQLFVLMLMSYVGLTVGASKGDLLNFTGSLAELFAGERPAARRSVKILDTSAIIDGRISDVVETGFLEGTLLVPEFVLRELQIVADSSDSSRRQRGRRGLDMLQKMQANPSLAVQVTEEDFPQIREVDLKLIELARKIGASIVTNDFNLSKVAQLHHVPVLNLNDLANSLKPLVLSGEKMNVFVLKEGKEYNQGVGYLDDGTMVVIDHARRMIGRAVDITVTSILQTASGKMIFGKLEESALKPEQVRTMSELPG